MLYAYIGVALIIGLLIGFVTLSVVWLSKRVTADIRSKTVDVISTYDRLLDSRRSELAELEEKLRAAKESVPVAEQPEPVVQEKQDLPAAAVLNVAKRIGDAAYVGTGMTETYRKIRAGFTQTPMEALARIPQSARDKKSGAATRLLSELNYETVFKLSILSGEEQLTLLKSVLNPEGCALLDEYTAAHRHFKAIGFYDWLTGKSEAEPHTPVLRVSPEYNGEIPDGVRVQTDADICEGFQIEADNVLYDYCIKGKELN